jgi:hypothetical protein
MYEAIPEELDEGMASAVPIAAVVGSALAAEGVP